MKRIFILTHHVAFIKSVLTNFLKFYFIPSIFFFSLHFLKIIVKYQHEKIKNKNHKK